MARTCVLPPGFQRKSALSLQTHSPVLIQEVPPALQTIETFVTQVEPYTLPTALDAVQECFCRADYRAEYLKRSSLEFKLLVLGRSPAMRLKF